MTPTPVLIFLAALLVFTTSRAAVADTPAGSAPHIRTTDRRLLRLVHEGARVSDTFRALVDRLRHSDVVVYLECAGNRSSDGRLAFVSSAGGYRYVHVRVARMTSSDQQIALIGHELQHAVEIADAPEVVDEASLARAYQRIGFLNPRAAGMTFDSEAAIETGYRVLRELLGSGDLLVNAQLPIPNAQTVLGSWKLEFGSWV